MITYVIYTSLRYCGRWNVHAQQWTEVLYAFCTRRCVDFDLRVPRPKQIGDE